MPWWVLLIPVVLVAGWAIYIYFRIPRGGSIWVSRYGGWRGGRVSRGSYLGTWGCMIVTWAGLLLIGYVLVNVFHVR